MEIEPMTKLNLHEKLPLDDRPAVRDALPHVDGQKVRRVLHAIWFLGGLTVATCGWTFRAGQFVATEQSSRAAVEQTVHDVNDPRTGLVSKQPATDMARYVTKDEFTAAIADVNRKLDRLLDYWIQRGPQR